MKIEHETPGVLVVRHSTPAEAIAASMGKPFVKSTSELVLSRLHLDRQSRREQDIADLLREPLAKDYEGEVMYERTLALVSLEKEIGIPEFFQEVIQKGYYPGSFSEGMSYFPILASHGIIVDALFHLGLILRIRKMEWRLLMRGNGSMELIPFFPITKLKPFYRLVVVKAEKPHRKT